MSEGRRVTLSTSRSAVFLTAALCAMATWMRSEAAPQRPRTSPPANAGQKAKTRASTSGSDAAQTKAPAKLDTKPSTVKGWVLHQNNRIVGDTIIYLTKNAVKLERPKTPLCLLCQAPDFKVQIYNTAAKCCYSCDLDKLTNLLDTGSVIFTGQLISKIPLVPTQKTAKVAGVSTLMFESTKAFNKKMETEVRSGNIQKSAAIGAQYYGAKDFGVPPQLVTAVNKYYGMPNTKLFPIKCIHYNGAHQERNEVSTSSCVETEIPLSKFEPPKGYKSVKRESDVTDGGEGELEGVIDAIYGSRKH